MNKINHHIWDGQIHHQYSEAFKKTSVSSSLPHRRERTSGPASKPTFPWSRDCAGHSQYEYPVVWKSRKCRQSERSMNEVSVQTERILSRDSAHLIEGATAVFPNKCSPSWDLLGAEPLRNPLSEMSKESRPTSSNFGIGSLW